jgi:hypothetical protein
MPVCVCTYIYMCVLVLVSELLSARNIVESRNSILNPAVCRYSMDTSEEQDKCIVSTFAMILGTNVFPIHATFLVDSKNQMGELPVIQVPTRSNLYLASYGT